MNRRLLRLYAMLLELMPPAFRHEFAGEMVHVLGQRLSDPAPEGIWTTLLLWADELLSLPRLWLVAIESERRFDSMARKNTSAWRQASWGSALLAALPLAVAIAADLAKGSARSLLAGGSLAFVYRALWSSPMWGAAIPMVLYLVVLGGLVAGWLRDSPAWVYPYLGWLLVFVLMDLWSPRWLEHSQLLTWLPLLAALLLAVLLRPSWRPLRTLARGWRRDWTLSVLAMISVLEFGIWASFDEMPGPRQLWESITMGILVLGVLAGMRARTRAVQILTLLGSALLGLVLSITVQSYYWDHWHGLPRLTGFVLWLAFLSLPPLLSALANRLWPADRLPQP